MYINNIFIVYDNGWDLVVYLKSVENVITLGKLIGLLFLFCHIAYACIIMYEGVSYLKFMLLILNLLRLFFFCR